MQSYSLVPELVKAGIPVKVDYLPPIAHDKIGVADKKRVITGSYNPTNQAKRNAENAIVINDQTIAADYLADYHARGAVSETWKEAVAKAKAKPSKHKR